MIKLGYSDIRFVVKMNFDGKNYVNVKNSNIGSKPIENLCQCMPVLK